MDSVKIKPSAGLGYNFIPAEFLPLGADEYYLRNEQNPRPAGYWRQLSNQEVQRLVANRNTSDNWRNVLVRDPFDPNLIRDTEFFGLVRIGCLRDIVLEHDNLQVPAGIRNSTIIACDIGDDVAIGSVSCLAHYIIGNQCILAGIGRMLTTPAARFGCGVLKHNQTEETRTWLNLINESGCRRVLPFDGMLAADAYLWARYRDHKSLQQKLMELTQQYCDARPGRYGHIGDRCVILNARIIEDVNIGSCGLVDGAGKLVNCTVNSSPHEPASIGSGVELVDGIIGLGCRVSSAAKALRFILGANCTLDGGARLEHSFIADNSTVAGCEVQNTLIFCAHEQHHNNSFLIAALLMGQTNIAAGATIGSNHNSRSNDLELHAGRGFWPGLCVSLRHPSRFASFTLLAKGDYPYELYIPLPFALVSNNAALDQLEIMPAFWWLHNMYALARNRSKFQNRDKRKTRAQHIEFDPLAPDTLEEILRARALLECWTAKAKLRQTGQSTADKTENELSALGRELLNLTSPDALKGLEVLGENLENSKRKTLIVKPFAAYHAYGQILHYAAVKSLLDYRHADVDATFDSMKKELHGNAPRQWLNLGGQLVCEQDIDRLLADIASGKLNTWQDIHKRYDQLWQAYPLQKQKYAFALLTDLYDGRLAKDQWHDAMLRAIKIQDYICQQVYQSRAKDFENPFTHALFRNPDEMTACLGSIDDNAFIQQVRAETDAFKKAIAAIAQRQ